jgi:YfiH family protein
LSEPVILDLTPEQAPGFRFWVTTRHGGASNGPFACLNLSLSVSDDPAAVQENRRRVLAVLGLRADRVVGAEQTHGDGVAVVTLADGGRGVAPGLPPVPGVDALITAEAGLFLFVQLADCYPLVLFDGRQGVVGLAHCGWRGTLLGLPAKLAETITRTFGTRPRELWAVIGPGIGPCCYEVGPDVVRAARLRLPEPEGVLVRRESRTFLDLPAAIGQWLEAAGLAPARILRRGLCTGCRTDLFYSHRAEGGLTGRFWAVAGLI